MRQHKAKVWAKWRGLISEQRESGKSIAEFCRDRGLVLAFVFFDHAAGKYRTFQVPDGRTVTVGHTTPWTWEIAELFKIKKGKIGQIEALVEHCPYGMGSGWSTREEALSSQAR